MKLTQGAGLIGDEALDFLAILSLPVNDLEPTARNDLDRKYSLSFTELVVCIY